MRMMLIYFRLLIIFSISCSTSGLKSQVTFVVNLEGDTIYFEEYQIREHQDRWVDGIHVSEDTLLNKKREYCQSGGKINGYSTTYENGRIVRMGHYQDNYKNGAWVELYESGKVKYIESMENGLLHGPSLYYSETGELISLKNFRYGNPIEP